ncbi:MAG: SusC/RagA family TonB-linked outer membrane protein, partial [Paludibacteraceae bacterium]|nr:SusC/RagA family TonB-linked outer membrane protein [Paludibacteraceae bacterium]
MKRIYLIICLLAGSLTTAFAQIIVRGTVVDDQNEPLIGVNVVVKGTSKGTITDMDGKFSLQINKNSDILVFSYLGYQNVEKQAETKRPMSILMREDKQALDEVVVIGYQDVRKRDLTGSVAKANIDDMLKAPVSSFDQALAGRVAGVTVSSGEGTPGGTMNIVIRGNNSVTQDNSPLYVIDGFPVEDAEAASTINPNDIESLDILKDASATAIYGSRGANGVVIITTKNGTIGAPVVSYDGSFGVQRVSRTIPLMDAYEFMRLQEEMYTTAEMQTHYGYYATGNDVMTEYGRIPSNYFANLYSLKGLDYRPTLDDYRNADQYDWQDLIFRDAWQQNHSISLTGGNTDVRYNASLSYFDQDGVVLNSNYNRFQGRAGLRVKKKKMTANMTVNFSRATSLGSSPSQSQYSGMNNLFYSVWGYRPVTQPGTALQDLIDNDTDDNVNAANDYRFNPIRSLQNEYRKVTTDNTQFNGFLEYEILKGLKIRATGGYTINSRRNETFNNSRTRYGSPVSTNKVNATFGTYERNTWLNEDYMTYQKTFNRAHNLNVMAGVSFQSSRYKYYSMQTTNIPYESL